MGLIGSIQQNFSQPKKIEAEKIQEVQEESPNLVSGHACHLCGSNDWWSPIGSPLKKICWACQSPTSQALVGVRFFFDDAGYRWLVTNNSNGSEIWEREDFGKKT